MIVLDTNVVSELMRTEPTDSVARWIASRSQPTLCTTAVTQAEILLGVQILPKGRRRDALEEAARDIFDQDFEGRVLSFDSEAARVRPHRCGAAAIGTSDLPGRCSDRGNRSFARLRPRHRNVSDFEGCGIEVHDPWRG